MRGMHTINNDQQEMCLTIKDSEVSATKKRWSNTHEFFSHMLKPWSKNQGSLITAKPPSLWQVSHKLREKRFRLLLGSSGPRCLSPVAASQVEVAPFGHNGANGFKTKTIQNGHRYDRHCTSEISGFMFLQLAMSHKRITPKNISLCHYGWAAAHWPWKLAGQQSTKSCFKCVGFGLHMTIPTANNHICKNPIDEEVVQDLTEEIADRSQSFADLCMAGNVSKQNKLGTKKHHWQILGFKHRLIRNHFLCIQAMWIALKPQNNISSQLPNGQQSQFHVKPSVLIYYLYRCVFNQRCRKHFQIGHCSFLHAMSQQQSSCFLKARGPCHHITVIQPLNIRRNTMHIHIIYIYNIHMWFSLYIYYVGIYLISLLVAGNCWNMLSEIPEFFPQVSTGCGSDSFAWIGSDSSTGKMQRSRDKSWTWAKHGSPQNFKWSLTKVTKSQN